jgi:hypothetical protein
MRRALFVFAYWPMLALWAPLGHATPQAPAPQQNSSYYVRNGDVVQLVSGDPAGAATASWQVWVYSQPVRVSPSGLGLVYSRWGVLEGGSAAAVMAQLAAYQDFERAYTSLFGTHTWGQYSFAYSVGPVAVTEQGQGDDPYALRSKIAMLDHQVRSVVAALHPSLVNAERGQATAAVQPDFQQVRNSMQNVARFYDRLSRLPGQQNYLAQEMALVIPGVTRAQSAVPAVRAILPSVKLPVSKSWMTHTEQAGKDGTINVTVAEVGSSAWIQQNWTGGDGSMTGTKIITIVPYQDIGTIDIEVSRWERNPHWTVRIHPANSNGFPQSVTSPERVTAKRTYRAVDLKTTEGFLYLEFTDPTDAQDAYAFFLYHKERGR